VTRGASTATSVERALAADAARRRRVEAPLQAGGIEAGRVDVDGVRGEVGRQPRTRRAQPFGEAEAERELLVVPRRPHRHRDRHAADADLERLLDGDVVALRAALRQPDDVHGRGRVRRRLHTERLRAADEPFERWLGPRWSMPRSARPRSGW